MVYQNNHKWNIKTIINFSCSTTRQTPEYRRKTSVEIHDDPKIRSSEAFEQIQFKPTILKLSLCGYSDAYVLCKGAVTITGAGKDATVRQADERSNT